MRRLAGRFLAMLVFVWARTLRLQVVRHPRQDASRRVFAFWHGVQFPLVAVPEARGAAVMVSWSKDGELQAGVLSALGLRVVRGSSSRGAVGGQRALVRALSEGASAVYAADGPRGPRGVAKAGALAAGRAASAQVIPVGCAFSRALTLGSWDAFRVPIPFSRVAVWFGAPVSVRATSDDLGRAMQAATRCAETLLRDGSSDPSLAKSPIRRGPLGG